MTLYFRLAASLVLAANLLPADVTYTQATKYEGGTMVDMMKKMASMPMMGRVMGGNRQAFEDQTAEVYIKGNKMARWGSQTASIYDLDAGSITTINQTKRTYTTVTFDEMQQKMEQAQQHMKQQGGGFDFDVKVTKTGQTKMVNGVEAKEVVITMTAKQANAQGQMVVTTHSWLVPYNAAAQEAVDFHRKLGQKFAYAMSGPGMGSAGQGVSSAINEAYKQEDGFPVQMEMEISGMTAPTGPMGGSGDPNAPLLKELIETDNFAKTSVDDSKFVIPAGFKEDKRGR